MPRRTALESIAEWFQMAERVLIEGGLYQGLSIPRNG